MRAASRRSSAALLEATKNGRAHSHLHQAELPVLRGGDARHASQGRPIHASRRSRQSRSSLGHGAPVGRPARPDNRRGRRRRDGRVRRLLNLPRLTGVSGLPITESVITDTAPRPKSQLEETRTIELGTLRGRLVAASVASPLIVFLPWPGIAWLRPLPIVLWFGLGAIAQEVTRTATTTARIRLASRLLITFDTFSSLFLIYWYWPAVPAAWAGMLAIIILAATRERELGAAIAGVLTTIMLFVGYIFHHTGVSGDQAAYNLIVAVAYTWIT